MSNHLTAVATALVPEPQQIPGGGEGVDHAIAAAGEGIGKFQPVPTLRPVVSVQRKLPSM